MEEDTVDSMKLYRLVEVELSGKPATLEPGRYVVADDDAAGMAVELSQPTTARALADQMEDSMRFVGCCRWFRPAPEGTA
jgi:hypothetical protein